MRRKKLKKTNEFNRGNVRARILMCFTISLALVGAGILLVPSALAQPHPVNGYVYECDGVTPIGGAEVTVLNEASGVAYYDVTAYDGYFGVTFGLFDWADGDPMTIWVNGTGAYAGWTIEIHDFFDATQVPQWFDPIKLCWYFKYANPTSPSGMPDFGVQYYSPTIYSDAAAAVANCLWWFDDNRPEYEPLVPPGETPDILIADLDNNYIMGFTDAASVQAAIDAYLLNYLLTSTDILYTTLYPNPDFFLDIAEELEISQNVLIQLYIEQTGEYLWVTGAGVNTSGMILAISDPMMDNAEVGGPGRIPVPHPAHPAGDTTHNDPSLVSHDFYTVGPGITAPWALLDYFGYTADIINVITVCPFIIEDLEIYKTVWDGAWVEYVEIDYGGTATINISVHNTGNSDLEDVNIYDMIPLDLVYVPGSATITPTTESPNYLAWEGLWPILQPDEWIYIEFDVEAVYCCSDQINEAEVTAFGPITYNNILKTDTATIHPMAIPNMVVTKEIWDPDTGTWSDYAEIKLGDNAQFRISIYNDPANNPCCALDIYVEDILDYYSGALEYVPGSLTVDGVPTTPDFVDFYTFIINYGSLVVPPGGTMQIIFEATAMINDVDFINAVYVEYTCTCGGDIDYAIAEVYGHIFFDNTPPTVIKTLTGPVCDANGPVEGTTVVARQDWELLATYNLPGSYPEHWENDVIDLSAYAGHTIQLGFRYLSNDEWGAYFDDIKVWDGISTIYHEENFDAYADGYDFDGTAACGFYTQENYGTACGSTYHYAEVENYKRHSLPNSAEIYYNCPNDDWLITPEIDLSAAVLRDDVDHASRAVELDFWYMWDDSWDILFEVYVKDLGGGGIAEYWITSDTEICFDVTDDISGAESLSIEVWYDTTNDGVVDVLLDSFFIMDNIDPRDMNPAVGEILYCLTLDEECYHEIHYYATDYQGNYPMNETSGELIKTIEIDMVDNTPPIINKTFEGPGTLGYLFLNEETVITLEATDLPLPWETGEEGRAMIEDFETGPPWPWSPWVTYGSGGTVTTAAAHDGTYGITDPGWHYRTDVAIGEAGDSFSCWGRLMGSGRIYLGFAASPSGCYSFVAAPNTGNIIIQQNSGYGYVNLVTSPQTWSYGQWYRMEVVFNTPTDVTCNLYDSDGTTLLNTASYSGISGAPGGIAIRSFGGQHIDTIQTGEGGNGGGPTGEGCGSGVVRVEYRIWYDGVWGNWTPYMDINDPENSTGPFTLEGGCTHYLQYRAIDCLGNTLLCEDDINETPLTRGHQSGGHMADYKFDPSDGTPEPASPTGSGGSVAPDRLVDEWLRYDNDINSNSLGLTAGGTMEWAIRLTPTELAGYDGWNFTTVQIHYGWSASSIPPHDILITVYDAGTASAPGPVITTESFYAPGVGWYDIPLTTPVVIDETKDIWISCTCTHLAGEYPAGMNDAVSVPGKGSWLNLGGWADYSSYYWTFNIAAGIEEGGVTPPPPPPGPPKNITVYNQTHYVDLEPPMSWIELELDHDGNMITPYTEFMIWQEDFACNQTGGSQCCTIHFRIDGPPGSMFYWNGQYMAADGSWHTGGTGLDEPVAFQIRDNTGYIKAGKYVVEFYATDCLGNTEATIHRQTYYPDTKAPTTTLLFSGPHYQDEDEWITKDTTITLKASDGESGTNVIKYQIDNGPTQTYSGPFTMPTEGKHTILYYGVDKVNNKGHENIQTVIVDSTAPMANLIFDGNTYDDETTKWITSDAHIQLPASDTGCGLKAIYYRVDTGDWTEYTDPFTLTSGTLIEFYAEDNLGNTPAIQQLTIGVDNEAPSITYTSPQENHLYIAGREILALRTESIIVGSLRIEATATDASGIDKIEFYIDGTLRYTEQGNNLQWLWDEKSLFTHTLTIKAYDNLGHISTKETTVKIFNF